RSPSPLVRKPGVPRRMRLFYFQRCIAPRDPSCLAVGQTEGAKPIGTRPRRRFGTSAQWAAPEKKKRGPKAPPTVAGSTMASSLLEGDPGLKIREYLHLGLEHLGERGCRAGRRRGARALHQVGDGRILEGLV